MSDPGPPTAVHFRYTPHDPFPSYLPAQDRAATLTRDDAAHFTSPPLSQELVIDGVPSVELSAHTTADGTDWILRLAHQETSGRLIELASAAITTITAGPSHHRVDLTPLSTRLPAGTRLVLQITSSDFPHLARHLGTGADRLRSDHTVVADQTIYCGCSTSLTLPTTRTGQAPSR